MTASLAATSRRSFLPVFAPIPNRAPQLFAAGSAAALLVAASLWAGHGFPLPHVPTLIGQTYASSSVAEVDALILGLQ